MGVGVVADAHGLVAKVAAALAALPLVEQAPRHKAAVEARPVELAHSRVGANKGQEGAVAHHAYVIGMLHHKKTPAQTGWHGKVYPVRVAEIVPARLGAAQKITATAWATAATAKSKRGLAALSLPLRLLFGRGLVFLAGRDGLGVSKGRTNKLLGWSQY